jgi:glycosyltransferase involved in cell wall biosynthesis
VLVVAQYFPPDLGGSATRAYNLAKGLALNGCNVTVIAGFPHYPIGIIPAEYRLKPFKVERMGNFRVIRTFMPPIKSVGFFRRLMLIGVFAVSALFALPFVGKVDAVWASSWVPGYVYGKAKRCPLALNVDDLTLEDLVDLKLIDENAFVLRIAKRLFRHFLVKGDVVTPISLGYIEIMKKTYLVQPSRIHFVGGGVDLSVFKLNVSKREPEKKFVVLYSGGFSVAYDFDQVFRAAQVVEKIDDSIEFVVQGSGELLGFMRDSVSKLKVKNVKIVDRILSRAEVAGLLGQADVLILPLAEFNKPYRGMSSKLYEYQAVGKPIISCSRGLPSVYVKATNSGLAVHPGDSEALARAVIDLKENPSLAREMGENGRKYVETEASIEAIGLRMKGIFEATTQRQHH